MKIPCKPLKDILTILDALLVDCVTIVPTDEGWEFYARDGTNCVLAALKLKREAFGEEVYEKWDPFSISLEFLEDSIDKKDTIELVIEDGFAKVIGEKSKSKKRLAYLDEAPRILPKIKLESSVAISSDSLIMLAKEKQFQGASAAELGLCIDIDTEGLTMSYETENDSYSETKDLIMADLPKEAQKSHYDPGLLLPMLKVLPKGIPVLFSMDTNKPVKMDVNAESYSFVMYVAPRIGE